MILILRESLCSAVRTGWWSGRRVVIVSVFFNRAVTSVRVGSSVCHTAGARGGGVGTCEKLPNRLGFVRDMGFVRHHWSMFSNADAE